MDAKRQAWFDAAREVIGRHEESWSVDVDMECHRHAAELDPAARPDVGDLLEDEGVADALFSLLSLTMERLSGKELEDI